MVITGNQSVISLKQKQTHEKHSVYDLSMHATSTQSLNSHQLRM